MNGKLAWLRSTTVVGVCVAVVVVFEVVVLASDVPTPCDSCAPA